MPSDDHPKPAVPAPKVGDTFMWLLTEVTITAVYPYRGKYPQWFTHDVCFTGPTGAKLRAAWPC